MMRTTNKRPLTSIAVVAAKALQIERISRRDLSQRVATAAGSMAQASGGPVTGTCCSGSRTVNSLPLPGPALCT